MKIEHVIYLTYDEYMQLLKDSKAKNKYDFKIWLKKYTQIETDFCVRVVSDAYDIKVIDDESDINLI